MFGFGYQNIKLWIVLKRRFLFGIWNGRCSILGVKTKFLLVLNVDSIFFVHFLEPQMFFFIYSYDSTKQNCPFLIFFYFLTLPMILSIFFRVVWTFIYITFSKKCRFDKLKIQTNVRINCTFLRLTLPKNDHGQIFHCYFLVKLATFCTYHTNQYGTYLYNGKLSVFQYV